MEENKKPKKNNSNKYMIAFFKKIAVYALIIWALLTFVFSVKAIKGNYMYPSLKDGDLVISYRLKKPVSGEAVIYKTPFGIRAGRVVAAGGDVVEISESGELRVNGSVMTEEIFYPTVNETTTIGFPHTVPADSYFILNDYRTLNDPDSRVFGAVAKKDVYGTVEFVFRRRGI